MMTQSTLANFSLETATPVELELRRREILASIGPTAWEDADPAVLHELALVARALRRKNAGPPKAAKPAKPAKATDADLDAI